eukprot:g2218.t1
MLSYYPLQDKRFELNVEFCSSVRVDVHQALCAQVYHWLSLDSFERYWRWKARGIEALTAALRLPTAVHNGNHHNGNISSIGEAEVVEQEEQDYCRLYRAADGATADGGGSGTGIANGIGGGGGTGGGSDSLSAGLYLWGYTRAKAEALYLNRLLGCMEPLVEEWRPTLLVEGTTTTTTTNTASSQRGDSGNRDGGSGGGSSHGLGEREVWQMELSAETRLNVNVSAAFVETVHQAASELAKEWECERERERKRRSGNGSAGGQGKAKELGTECPLVGVLPTPAAAPTPIPAPMLPPNDGGDEDGQAGAAECQGTDSSAHSGGSGGSGGSGSGGGGSGGGGNGGDEGRGEEGPYVLVQNETGTVINLAYHARTTATGVWSCKQL